MDNLETQSLAQIVNSNHRAAAVFEKYRLDFCCKGKRTLQQACLENELQTEEVLADLAQLSGGTSCTVPVNFGQFTLQQLSDYIIQSHHSFVKKEMPSISLYLEKVASKHGDRHPEVRKVLELFEKIKAEMTHHMEKEEQVLFPRIKEIEKQIETGEQLTINSSYLLSPVVMMENEHEHAGGIMAAIRELTHNYEPPADACTTFRLLYASLQAFEMDLHQHVHLENNILFPKALMMLVPGDSCRLN